MYTNKDIWNVTYPIFLGLLAQNVINVTDTAFLGHVGEVALGASAMGGLLYICFYTVAFGFSVGSQILIARRNGEGNYHSIGPIMWQGSAFSLGMAVALLLLMFVSAGPLIRLLISSDTIYEATYEFYTWRMWGFIFSFLNVMFRALYIGITRTKVLTWSAIVMAAVNVFLDYALIFGHFGLPAMGVKGAALASVIAEGSCLLFYLIYTYTCVDLKKYGLNRFGSFDWEMVMHILRISCFTMLQYFLAMAIWFVFFMALERLGQRQLAIANIVRSVYVVLLIPVQALSTTANSLVSNLIGSGGVAKVMALLNKIARMSIYIMIVAVGLCVLFPDALLSVYTAETALLDESRISLYVICLAMLISASANIYFNGISGTGNTQAALILEIVVQVFYALYVIVVGMILQAPVEICFTTEIVYYALMLSCSLIYLKKAKWQNKKI
ncbi:MATE family efflux transporter [uncultured Bacteroides sp.]|uniref:MATE family efflux transporter n=1 Tax=uncultured Bacteroides sp. TaxID=162156 RepID=UPI002633CC7E|nr:MATE family efflux transporter [uncultured Bacteroides sp.]